LAERLDGGRKTEDEERTPLAAAWGDPGAATPTDSTFVNRQSSIVNQAIFPDANAEYVSTHVYNAADLEPYVACPHSVDNVVPVSALAGTRVQQAFIGTCTNGRLEDLAAAAAVLQGQRIAAGTRLLVIPASSRVLQEALRLGYIQTFIEAGAVVGVPGCGPCMGNHMGIPAPGEVTISSANRNFQGRMGTRDAEIYLSNPAVVAASAIAGVSVEPRGVMSKE
jgi:homoaconitase/3-isopropylmalate dehydratase large subunit